SFGFDNDFESLNKGSRYRTIWGSFSCLQSLGNLEGSSTNTATVRRSRTLAVSQNITSECAPIFRLLGQVSQKNPFVIDARDSALHQPWHDAGPLRWSVVRNSG